MSSVLFGLGPLFFICLLPAIIEGGKTTNKLLLVSMDGFRWDYIKNISGLGNFSRMARTGVTVDHLNNPFATWTFPSHFTLVTGLYEESHGIVANSMYDPIHNAFFNKSSQDTFWWEGGEPIWITAEKHKRNSTGVFFWVGSEAKIQNLRPYIYRHYNESVTFEERTRTAIGWFVEEDVDFVALYFHEPDRTGHTFGPSSPEMVEKVREMDGYLGLILELLDQKNLTDEVNLIVTSDHGMTEVDAQHKLLDLYHYINESFVEHVPSHGEVTAILPKEGREEEVMQAAKKIPHVTAYRKEDLPEHFHYRNNPRIMPIIILSEEGWLLSSEYDEDKEKDEKGSHGYNNELPSMNPIFFARGPDFRKGYKSEPFRSIDLYPLMCRLLGLPAAPNNGSLENTAHLLAGYKPASSAVTTQNVFYVSVLGLIASLLVIT